MTRDEAIKTLRSMKSDFPLPKAAQTRRAQNDALDVAIEALKVEPCEDTISRQAAVDALNKLDVSDGVGISSIACDLQEEAIRSIENLPSVQPDPHWIPCSKKLPEYMESVLTWDGVSYCVEKRIRYIRDEEGNPIEGDWWVSDEYDDMESDYYLGLRDGAVIAWMPLPEPYKEGRQ